MARHIHSRLKIIGDLMAETPLHVGGYGESFETDMALARNGKDEFYIPGTSLTGTLRSWFVKNFPNDVDSIWGYQSGDKGHASFVLVEDLTLPEQVQSELRDGVGIDRIFGTAADKAKFDRTILPKGTKLNFEMTVEIQNDADKIKARFAHLLEALQSGKIRLGASKTRGLGKVKLQNIKMREDNLLGLDILNLLENKAEQEKRFEPFNDFKTNLQNIPDGETESLYQKIEPQNNSQIEITIKWQPKSALMVKAGYDGIGVDMLPLTSGSGKDQVSLCLPGSSIKGAFRSHAERIMRTLLEMKEEKVKHEELSKKKFHEQINKIKLVDELFGAKKEKDGQAPYLGLGALSIDDCYAQKEFAMNSNDWASVETGKVYDDKSFYEGGEQAEEVTLWQGLKKIEGEPDLQTDTKNFHISHHVAIDRWTGGASEGALYSVLQPTAKIGWQDIYLTLDLARLPADKKLKSLMLLLLVLRDFAENRLPLGFATNRGMGEVEVEKIEITGLYNILWETGKFNFKDDENIMDEDEKLRAKIQKEWQEWISQNQTPNN